MSAAGLEDGALLDGFERATLAPDRFGHREHVRVAWLYLARHPLLDALARFDEALRRFAAANGAAHKYHATITWALVLTIHERRARGPAGQTWPEFAAAHPELLIWPSPVLAACYQPATLASPRARRTFVLPDRR